jgi:hypothetical protein
MTTHPTAWINQDRTWFESTHGVATPLDVADGGLGALLNRLDPKLTSPATVLLAGDMPALLGFPATAPKPKKTTARKDATVPVPLQSARDAGWKISAPLRPWMIFLRPLLDDAGRPVKNRDGQPVERVIHVGILPWLTEETFPLITKSPALLVWRMWVWQQMLDGETYHGEIAGLGGVSLMRDHWRGRGRTPCWQPKNWDRVAPAHAATEIAYMWVSPTNGSKAFEHEYDVTSQYLSAAGMVELARDTLKFDGSPGYTPGRKNDPGYYQITIPPVWEMAGKIPHPAGHYRPGDVVWVTAPTLDLLVECAEEHRIMALPAVHARWTADAGIRVLREWSETIMAAVKRSAGLTADPEFREGLKHLYTQALGLIQTEKSRVIRPDWAHAVTAYARALLWRKIYREGTTSGRWPVEVKADQVWYASDDADATSDASWPATFRRGWQVPGSVAAAPTGGTFTHKHTRQIETVSA